MSALIGMICGVIVCAAFAGGGALGWYLRGRQSAGAAPDKAKQKELQAQAEALSALYSYSADMAYGTHALGGGESR